MRQSQRENALGRFRNGGVKLLIATDLAARGLDIPRISHVINYDVPGEPADYIHRIGRTARAQKAGDAITFVSHDETELFAQIERSIGKRVDRAAHALNDASISTTLEKAPQARRRTFTRRRR